MLNNASVARLPWTVWESLQEMPSTITVVLVPSTSAMLGEISCALIPLHVMKPTLSDFCESAVCFVIGYTTLEKHCY